MRICLIDDDVASLNAMRLMVKRAGHAVKTYTDPVLAIDEFTAAVAEGEPLPDAVLTDQMMPSIDGMTVVRRLRELSQVVGRYCYIVVVSGQDDDELARSVLAVGADDYLVKARAAGQILVRLATAKRIVDLEDQQRHQHVALQEALKELQQANHVMKLDLARAGALQKLQLPDNAGTLPGLRYSAAYKPCETLGGDHYGAFALGRDRSLVFLLDAAGHGVSAALLALQANRQIVSAQGRLRMEGDGPAALLELVTDLNDTFQQRRISSYFTLFCAIIDAQHQHVTAISCGHPAAVRLRGQQAELLASRSPAIGLLPSSGAQWDIQQFDFQDDEHLVLYSDGLIESENETGDFFEHDLLIASLQAGQQAGASDLAHQLMNALEAWRGASPVQDDASVLALNLRAAVA